MKNESDFFAIDFFDGDSEIFDDVDNRTTINLFITCEMAQWLIDWLIKWFIHSTGRPSTYSSPAKGAMIDGLID